jgi:Fe-S-cluster containining protein
MTEDMPRETRCLSFHRRYQCRHHGACCTAGWPIPVEANQLARLRAALATGALGRRARTRSAGSPFVTADDAPADTPALLARVEHRCVFYDPDARRCGVQRALDHDALPLACRQFPRVSLRDPRGVSVTLSHYCPTAASMLDSDEPVGILINAPAFPASGEYVGLEVGAQPGAADETPLPPLLRPAVLMDWESWWEWEWLSVDLLVNADQPAARALAQLAWAVETTRAWRPGDGRLLDQVRSAFDRAHRTDPPPFAPTGADLAIRVDEVTRAIPEELRGGEARRPTRGAGDEAILTRFLAAHAFASWTAHLGRGLRTWLRSVEAALALTQSGLDVAAVDLRLRHLADPHLLAKAWARAELRQ